MRATPVIPPAETAAPVAPPESRAWLWSLVAGLAIFAAIAFGVFSTVLSSSPRDSASLVTNWMQILIIVALAQGWNFIGGYTGYSAFGNVAFFGIGAYAVTIVMNKGAPFWLGLLVGLVVAGLVALVLGIPALRLKGQYFAVATLGIAQVMQKYVAAANVAGPGGESSPPLVPLSQTPVLLAEILGLCVVLLLVTVWLSRSRFGYALVAIRENEQAAEALGIATTWYKVAAYVMSAAPAAIAGGIFVYFNTEIDPGTYFDPAFTVTMVLVTFLGGAGTILGPIIGAIAFEYVSQQFNLTSGSFLGLHLDSQILLGALVVIVTLFIPQGIIRFAQEFIRPTGQPQTPVQRFTEGVRRVRRFIAANGI